MKYKSNSAKVIKLRLKAYQDEIEFLRTNLHARNGEVTKLLKDKKDLEEDLNNRRFHSFTQLIESIATINKSLATVVGEIGHSSFNKSRSL